jgi:hypothetical protein
LPQTELILDTTSKLDSLQATVDYLKELLEKMMTRDAKIDDWITEKEAIRITGLCRSTLLKLRKEGELTSSTLSGKQNFYRLSDIKKLLDLNETKR